jgi:hypothetical protein
VSAFPAFDDPQEVMAVIYAIDKVREMHKLPPYRWSPVELVELGLWEMGGAPSLQNGEPVSCAEIRRYQKNDHRQRRLAPPLSGAEATHYHPERSAYLVNKLRVLGANASGP